MESDEVRVALLEGEGAEREAEGDVVDGVGLLGGCAGGGGGDGDFGAGGHCGDNDLYRLHEVRGDMQVTEWCDVAGVEGLERSLRIAARGQSVVKA